MEDSGLGVKNLSLLQALALRVRGIWLRRTDPHRPWHGLELMVDDDARQVFDSMVNITVGKGDKILFWRDRWIHGFLVSDIAPMLAIRVDTRTRNSRTVARAFTEERWVLVIQPQTSVGALLQMVHLRHAIAMVQRDEQSEDSFAWPRDPSGGYTAKCTYTQLNHGGIRFPTATGIWRSWAPLKCKIFAWLAVQHI
jgi:hypothetical protein